MKVKKLRMDGDGLNRSWMDTWILILTFGKPYTSLSYFGSLFKSNQKFRCIKAYLGVCYLIKNIFGDY